MWLYFMLTTRDRELEILLVIIIVAFRFCVARRVEPRPVEWLMKPCVSQVRHEATITHPHRPAII